MKLNEEELVLCRKAFQSFDKDGSGTIDVKELKAALSSMGQEMSDEELFVMIHDVDEDNSGEIEFSEFCKVILKHKAAASDKEGAEADTLDAFVALGGNPDRSGKVSTEKLRATIKAFELTLDVDRLIKEVDLDRSGFLDFKEFAAILKG
ncbi:Dynein light chain, flagellar outer arm [Monoraphidium neglectum]|uniref:Dynein light chain, flagellar outer arm n=1 Tax=Monoraphidium neglectum TaxID=145388 RepID=A0A0D2NR09_9CHLO|nr:Dynein light chain, flagellar outer arm [Monoraphidium neglectum]KIZ06761.1 Dynein light chain, flagellar outer arm [Monoraphidium neglectum]|eukprot:XP_013905780.1 Dynein light chain, flagellar outer arm [Monoraphidium neglectum]